LIQTPIRQVLLTIQASGTRTLLMGGQACVFYGAAQVSKDVDFLILADEANLKKLHTALATLAATRIAVPAFDSDVLARGHAVHFRCAAPGVEGLRIDVMSRLRDLSCFNDLWERRTVIGDADGNEFHLLSVPDLVQAKKTQRAKDWPVIEALVSIHFRENSANPQPDWLEFWLGEARSPELLIDLTARFPTATSSLLATRPLLALARSGNLPDLRAALDAEVRAEQDKDRCYWEPLKREIEAFRRIERETQREA
jgi:hypothetical protein